MPQTYTGVLINDGSAVAIENGPLLAVRGANGIAVAAGKFAEWGQTSPVTVTGDAGFVGSESVLFVTSIGWASAAANRAMASGENASLGGVMSLEPAKKRARKKKAVKKSAPRKARKKT